jgi:hypothetical protein
MGERQLALYHGESFQLANLPHKAKLETYPTGKAFSAPQP